MTSKNSFWASRKENLKRRSTVIVLCLLGQLLAYPVVLIMYYSRIQARYAAGTYGTEVVFRKQMVQATCDALCFSYYAAFMAGMVALLLALQGFSFLFSKRKEDMYYSVPVSMKKRFWTVYENGVLIYVATSLLSLVLSLLISVFQGAITGRVFGRTLISYVFVSGLFLAVYSLVILAVMLTGHFLAAMITSGVLLLYVAVWKEILFSTYKYAFFHRATGTLQGKLELTAYNYASYVNMTFSGIDAVRKVKDLVSVMKTLTPYVLVWLILSALMTSVALKLYKKRPTEAAGKALAFDAYRPVFKILLLVPFSLVGGGVAYSLTESNVYLMGVTIALSAMLMGFVLETIFEEDIRCFYRHMAPTVVAIGLALGIFGIYKFDVFHYDTYVPDPDQVESYLVLDYNFAGFNDHWEIQDGNEWINDSIYLRDHMFLKDAEAICALANKTLNVKEEDLENCHQVSVLYRLKDGREISRQVYIDFGDELSWSFIDRVYSTPEYVQGYYQLAHMDEIDETSLKECNYYKGYSEERVRLQSAKELANAWVKDMSGLKITSLLNGKTPVGRFEMQFKPYYYLSGNVYEDFYNTLAVLKKYGVDPTSKLTADQVQLVRVTNNHSDIYEKFSNYYFGETEESEMAIDEKADLNNLSKTVDYENPELISEILEAAVPGELVDGLSGAKVDYDYEIEILLKNDVAISLNVTFNPAYRFMVGRVPEFVEKDTEADKAVLEELKKIGQ